MNRRQTKLTLTFVVNSEIQLRLNILSWFFRHVGWNLMRRLQVSVQFERRGEVNQIARGLETKTRNAGAPRLKWQYPSRGCATWTGSFHQDYRYLILCVAQFYFYRPVSSRSSSSRDSVVNTSAIDGNIVLLYQATMINLPSENFMSSDLLVWHAISKPDTVAGVYPGLTGLTSQDFYIRRLWVYRLKSKLLFCSIFVPFLKHGI